MRDLDFDARHKTFPLHSAGILSLFPHHPVTGSKTNSTGEINRHVHELIRFDSPLHKNVFSFAHVHFIGSNLKFYRITLFLSLSWQEYRIQQY